MEKKMDLPRMTCVGEYGGGRGREGVWDVKRLPHWWGHGGRGELGVEWIGCSV